jgi:hypothetical protein
MFGRASEKDSKVKVMPVKLSPSLLAGKERVSSRSVSSGQERKMKEALNQIITLVNAAGKRGKGDSTLFNIRDIAVGALMPE